MKIYFCDELFTIPFGTTLNQALDNLKIPKFGNSEHYAVLVNNEFISHSLYHLVQLQPQDRIEIITPMQGG